MSPSLSGFNFSTVSNHAAQFILSLNISGLLLILCSWDIKLNMVTPYDAWDLSDTFFSSSLTFGILGSRYAPLSQAVDISHSTAWSTCGHLQIFAMLALMLLKWLQQHSRPAVVMPLVYGALSLQVTVHRKERWRKTTSPRKQVYMRILKFLSTCYGCGAKVLSTKQVYIGKFIVPCTYNLGTSDRYLSNSWG